MCVCVSVSVCVSVFVFMCAYLCVCVFVSVCGHTCVSQKKEIRKCVPFQYVLVEHYVKSHIGHF